MRRALPLLSLVLAAPAAAAPDAGAPPPHPAPVTCGAWKMAQTPLKGSIAGALTSAVPDQGSQLAAHFARLFMWDLDLRHDLDPGDQLWVLWRQDAAGDPEIAAARYTSGRLGRTLRAYRFRDPEDAYPSYWDERGQEVPRRLKATPLHDYEQITALLKDRPTHQGMDFKTPVGTPVHAPRGGVVSRIDWKLHGNGHCVELQYEDGVAAKFLHLSAVKVKRQARVAAGQVIALTGNTGHSTAPHLHYQLSRGPKILDPLDYHGTTRRKLSGAALRAFAAEVAKLDGACGRKEGR